MEKNITPDPLSQGLAEWAWLNEEISAIARIFCRLKNGAEAEIVKYELNRTIGILNMLADVKIGMASHEALIEEEALAVDDHDVNPSSWTPISRLNHLDGNGDLIQLTRLRRTICPACGEARHE